MNAFELRFSMLQTAREMLEHEYHAKKSNNEPVEWPTLEQVRAKKSSWEARLESQGDVEARVAKLKLAVSKVEQSLQQQAAKLHDASEYVTHDLITPLKAVVGDVFKEVELRLTRAIHIRFGLPPVLATVDRALIKRADQIAAAMDSLKGLR